MVDSSSRVAGMSAVKLALLARQMRSQVEDVLRAEPVAVVGMSCRVPGANSLESLWSLLINGDDAIGEVPADRWDIDTLYDSDFNAPGKISSRYGGFLDQIDGFDPTFFGITPREAQRMDPQQRLFLEVAYEALEDAGVTHFQLNDSQAGVFVASYHDDYSQMQYAHPDLIDGRTLTGTLQSIVSNRLSFLLNTHGPSLTLDTACSSSLVAIHLACQSLRNRECELAVAGGVNLMMGAELNISMSRVGFLSPRGRCRTFDAGADGFVRGEGSGVIILKRLADAIADGDHIRAVIRGSAVNQDGRSNVLTAPNGMAQRQLLHSALENAGLNPEQITYVEAHGTGTALGDPIEVEALADVLGQGEHPCVVSSIKTNIGHLEAAAGVIGLIKSVLSLEHERVPGNVHFTRLNPHISLDGTRLVISGAAQSWKRNRLPRFVGVSSFGVGGTNAHVILEEAPQLPAPLKPNQAKSYLLPLSAHTLAALQVRAADLRDWLNSDAALNLNDLCYTASAHRNHHDYRLSVVGTSIADVVEQLDGIVQNAMRPGSYMGHRTEAEGKLAFVFSGQGPQWWAMGRELFEEESVFRQTIERIDSLLQPYSHWSLIEELQAEEQNSRLEQTEVAQPAIFALQVALAALWRTWGILPEAVVGHSVGEIAAAHVAGILSLEDAVRVVYHRARLMQAATGYGKMAAVELSAEEAEQAIAPYADRLSVAAVNSPSSVTLSGEPDALESLLGELNLRGVATKMLRVNYAFHSPQMEPFQVELVAALQGLKLNNPVIPIFSTVSGNKAVKGEFGATYWGDNIRQPVRFAQAVNGLMSEGFTTFVEISPHPALTLSLEQCLNGDGVVLPSLRRGRPERLTLLSTLGGLYVRDFVPDWKGLYPSKGGYVRLPDYPWQRERYWLDIPKTKPTAMLTGQGHPLLGKRLNSPSLTDIVYETELSGEWPTFISDHLIFDVPVLPATAYIEMALSALMAHTGKVFALDDFLIQEALKLDNAKIIQTILRQDEKGFVFEVFSHDTDGDKWVRHASGRAHLSESMPQTETLESVQANFSETITPDHHYGMMAAQGVSFGSRFQGVQALWRSPQEVLARIELDAEYESEAHSYSFYPPLLDACLQALSAAFNLESGQADLYLPLNIGQLQVKAPITGPLWSHARIREAPSAQKQILAGDVHIYNDVGDCVAVVQNFQFIQAKRDAISRNAGQSPALSNLLYETKWQPVSLTVKSKVDNHSNWLLIGGKSGVELQVAQQLRSSGYNHVLEVDSRQSSKTYADMIASVGTDRALRIVYLSALDAQLNDHPQAEQTLIYEPLFPILQAFQHMSVELFLVTRRSQSVISVDVLEPQQATLWGLANTLALEFPTWRCVRIDLDADDQNLNLLLNDLVSDIQEERIAYRDGQRYVARFSPMVVNASQALVDRPTHLEIPASHVIEDLVFEPLSRRAPANGEVEIHVMATGLNFRDVLKTLGMYPGPAGSLGDECAGEIAAVGPDVTNFKVGDRVVGVVSGGFDSYITSGQDLLVPLADNISYEDGAGIPIAFLTAYYALHHLANLQAGQRVLIHAAAGGVGLAAVQLALLAGAEVIGTAGSPEKRDFLKSLGVQQVFNSRTLEFADEIMTVTNGEGVDIVLNSLSGDFIPKSLSLLQKGGSFLEIGKTGIWDREQVAALNPNTAYHVIFLGKQFENEPALMHSMLTEVMDAIAGGRLQLLPKQVFPINEIANAFRYMAQAKHIGKIIVARQANRKSIYPDVTYLITGGLSGIGLEVTQWLASQGARSLILLGRRTASEHTQAIIDRLRGNGVQVIVEQADVASADDMQRIIETSVTNLPPLRGIFHCAGVNDDGLLLNLDESRFETVMNAKVTGTWNLHRFTQHLPLDHFVLFSSIAANLGSVAQANYAAANAFLDGMANWRRTQGLAALSVNWGAWENLGMTAVLSSANVERLRRQGMQGLTSQQAMSALAQLLSEDVAQATVLNMDWKAFEWSQKDQLIAPFFGQFVRRQAVPVPNMAVKSQDGVLIAQLRDLPIIQRRRVLLNHIREQAGIVMGLSPSILSDVRQPFNAMGLDSLMAVELRNALVRSTGEALPATLIFDYPTLEMLTGHVLNDVLKLGEVSVSTLEPVPSTQSVGSDEVASLTDDEAEALLLEELMKPKKKG